MSVVLIGASPDGDAAIPYRGFIDLAEATRGVGGWALDMANPAEPVRLELLVGTTRIAETLAGMPREDVARRFGLPARPGFRFSPAAIAEIGELPFDPALPVSVRVAGTGFHLRIGRPTTAGQFVAVPAAETATPGSAIEARFAALREAASGLVRLAPAPMPEGQAGHIDTLATDACGKIWFRGWMRFGHPDAFPAVVTGDPPLAAAVTVAPYTRDDVPADAAGVLGVIDAAWPAGRAAAGLVLCFGPEARHHLRADATVRQSPPENLATDMEAARAHWLEPPRMRALLDLLREARNGAPARPANDRLGVDASVDRVLVIPGFGCMVEGWALSPLRAVTGMRLRIGRAVLAASPERMFRKPRPDLLASVKHAEGLVARAGFVALLTGDVDAAALDEPVLLISLEGGETATHSIPPRSLRILGHSASIEEATRFFPALAEEGFFAEFAAAAARAERRHLAEPVAVHVTRTERALILTLPPDRCDLFLLFERLRAAPPPEFGGFVFLGGTRNLRADALWQFRAFAAASEAPCSLLLLEAPELAFAALPAILRAVGIARFAFAAAGVLFTPAGLALAAEALAPGREDLIFFRGGGEHAAAARCFAWSGTPFIRWSRQAQGFLGGTYRDNRLAEASPPLWLDDAMRETRPNLVPRLTELVNQALFDSARVA